MPAGRPTTYDEAFCDKVIELGKLGKSRVQIACELDVDPKTLRDWAGAHEEFSLALLRAKAFEQDWWENAGQTGMVADKFNAAVWKKSMEARFREDYTERQEFSGPEGGPIEMSTSPRKLAKAMALIVARGLKASDAGPES